MIVWMIATWIGLAHAQGGVVDNGGGLAEQNFLYAWSQSSRLLAECRRGRGCTGYTQAQLGQLEQLDLALSLVPPAVDQIQFKDPSDDPHFFTDGATELDFRAPAHDLKYFVNRARLYREIRNETVALTVPELLPLVFAVLAESRLHLTYSDSVRLFKSFVFQPAKLGEEIVIGHRLVEIPAGQRPHLTTWIFPDHNLQSVTDLVITDVATSHRLVCSAAPILICHESIQDSPSVELFNLNVERVVKVNGHVEATVALNYVAESSLRTARLQLHFDQQFRLATWSLVQ